jgi:two-component system response regulator PilR (NtrC family)
VGSQTEIPVDIRLLSATHKNLADEVEQGNMRQDLYYRINVIEVHVPPLRERKDDLPLLVDHILAALARESSQPPVHVTNEVLQAMQHYAFPGNIRELENMLQRACALTDDAVIRLGDLPELRRPGASQGGRQLPATNDMTDAVDAAVEEADYSLERHLEDVERAAIEKALLESRWNRTAAARKLGMSFRAFRYRLKKLGLD